ncbi:MAG: adenylate cyclase [Solirubrobacteraceae bacterium]|nr:adenylate cyclase [Solirubrobacteraceae bacterium]
MRRALLLLVVAVLGAAAGLVATAALRPLERLAIDARFKIRSDDTRPRDVAVVGVDPEAIRRFGLPPFKRRVHARVIRALTDAGAEVIAYDFEFIAQTSIRDDNALARAIRRAGNVVLATTSAFTRTDTAVLGGMQNVRAFHATVGFAGFPGRVGDVFRRIHAELEHSPTLAAAAVARAGEPVPRGSHWIDYRGDVDVIPFVDAHAGRLPDLHGKVVVVGDVDISGQDIHATPLGTRSGPEINAAAIDTLLRGAPLHSVPGWWMLIALGAIVPLSALRLTGLRWLPVAGLLAVAWPVAAQLAFDGDRIVPFVPGATGLLVGSLGTLVVVYAVELRQRRQLRAHFARFAPDSVVDALVDQAEGAALPGIRVEATVLFADLRGFTAAAERLGAEGVIALLNRYLSAMGDAILDHGGTVVSFMGDGIMAVFGAPLAQPDHADRAVAAARELAGPRLAAFNAETGETFAMGIGVASGPVMSGTVGSERRVEYAAVGDTTNIASRLEALTKDTPHAVLIADSTRAALQRPVDLVDAGERELRGKAEPLRTWTVP